MTEVATPSGNGPASADTEAERVAAVRATGLLDAPEVPTFDAITDLLAAACEVPVALVSLVDDRRQFFASHHGLSVRETPRDQAFCAHALETPDEILVVEDSLQDARFADNPLVTGPPYIRFYAGMPLRAPSGHVLGTVCIIDQVPRPLYARQEQLLRHAARQVEVLIAEAVERRQLTERQAELVETNQELEQSIAERSQFLAVAKHKLKTPLAVIAGWSSTLQAFDSLGEADRAEGLAAIERAAGELRAQIDDLLDEARIHMVGQTMKLEHLVLVEFVDAVLAELKVDPTTHPVSVAIEPNIVVHAHREGLRHIIAHLVDNAVKYSPDGGAIRLSAQPGDPVRFQIADEGIGLPDDDDELFEPFHRGSNATKTARGTGLGLHIVRLLSSNMGGAVRVVDHDDAGAVFEVTLPA